MGKCRAVREIDLVPWSPIIRRRSRRSNAIRNISMRISAREAVNKRLGEVIEQALEHILVGYAQRRSVCKSCVAVNERGSGSGWPCHAHPPRNLPDDLRLPCSALVG